MSSGKGKGGTGCRTEEGTCTTGDYGRETSSQSGTGARGQLWHRPAAAWASRLLSGRDHRGEYCDGKSRGRESSELCGVDLQSFLARSRRASRCASAVHRTCQCRSEYIGRKHAPVCRMESSKPPG